MNNSGSADTGLLFMICCLSSPALIGAIVGWQFRGRWSRLGWWALVPGFVKYLIEKILDYGE